MTTARRVILDQYRTGTEAAAKLVALDEITLPDPGPGEVLIRTTHVQLAAVLADLMRENPNLPMAGYKPGEPLWAGAVGEVIAAGEGGLAVGTAVAHRKGLQSHVIAGPWEAFPVDPALPEPYFALNQGVTAYHGMVDVAEVSEGDVVFVSGAAGGVGSLAGQIAKARGAKKVIGSAGSAAKLVYLTEELGYDAALDYRDGDLVAALKTVAPDGIDVFFDTVGGTQFEAAVQVAAVGARFALCGALAGQLDDSVGAHPRLDIMTAINAEIVLKPFRTMHTPEQLEAWSSHYSHWLADGSVVYPHTLVPGGLDVAAATLDALLAGTHRGTVLVELA
jgi:NADPH-dependent curcumin reductase CurA